MNLKILAAQRSTSGQVLVHCTLCCCARYGVPLPLYTSLSCAVFVWCWNFAGGWFSHIKAGALPIILCSIITQDFQLRCAANSTTRWIKIMHGSYTVEMSCGAEDHTDRRQIFDSLQVISENTKGPQYHHKRRIADGKQSRRRIATSFEQTATFLTAHNPTSGGTARRALSRVSSPSVSNLTHGASV